MNAKALVHSELARQDHLERLKSIKLSTYGILFLGTPHQGGNGVPLAKRMVKVLSLAVNTSDRALKHIDKESELLKMQISQFNAIGKDFDLKFFYEMYSTPSPVGPMVVGDLPVSPFYSLAHQNLDCSNRVSSYPRSP